MPLLAETIRPGSLDEVRGNEELKAYLKSKLQDPNYDRDVLFFVGEAGTGKTSVARILGKILAGDDFNVREINIAGDGGKEALEEIQSDIHTAAWPAPGASGWKVFILDEADAMTPAARPLLKKMLEDLPARRLVVLTANSDKPFKERAFQSRMKVFSFGGVSEKEILGLLKKVNRSQKFGLTLGELKGIASRAEGSVRQAVTFLEQQAAIRTFRPKAEKKTDKKKLLAQAA